MSELLISESEENDVEDQQYVTERKNQRSPKTQNPKTPHNRGNIIKEI